MEVGGEKGPSALLLPSRQAAEAVGLGAPCNGGGRKGSALFPGAETEPLSLPPERGTNREIDGGTYHSTVV